MGRKTVNVDYMKAYANASLAGSDPALKEVRIGIALMISEMLMRSGNYKGYRYLDLENDSTRVEYF